MKLEWAMEECTVCFTDMRQVDEHGARLTFANLRGMRKGTEKRNFNFLHPVAYCVVQ
jgi:hypothetical protein